MAIDPDRWRRLIFTLLYETEAEGDIEPERSAIFRFMQIRHELWLAHIGLRGPHPRLGCHICAELLDEYRDPKETL